MPGAPGLGALVGRALNHTFLSLRSKPPEIHPEVNFKPVMGLADHTLDFFSIGERIINPFKSIADEIADAYRNHVYGHATLQDLPSDGEGPRFVINATNVQTKVLWRFSKPFMGDYRVGLIRDPKFERE